jgi:hypothetical protein
MIGDILTLHGSQAGDLPARLQQYKPPPAPTMATMATMATQTANNPEIVEADPPPTPQPKRETGQHSKAC